MALYLSRYLKESIQVQYPKLDWQRKQQLSIDIPGRGWDIGNANRKVPTRMRRIKYLWHIGNVNQKVPTRTRRIKYLWDILKCLSKIPEQSTAVIWNAPTTMRRIKYSQDIGNVNRKVSTRMRRIKYPWDIGNVYRKVPSNRQLSIEVPRRGWGWFGNFHESSPSSIILVSHNALADLLSNSAGKLTSELQDIKSEDNITSILKVTYNCWTRRS